MRYQSALVLLTFFLLGAGCMRDTNPPSSTAWVMVPKPVPPETAPSAVNLPRAKSLPGARVFFAELKEGQNISSPVTVKFASGGIEIAKAGEVKENSGHFHLLVDVDTLPPMDQALPFNEHVLHFGQAQTEATVNLSPGPHTLQILLAAGNHVPHDPPVVSERINIVVK